MKTTDVTVTAAFTPACGMDEKTDIIALQTGLETSSPFYFGEGIAGRFPHYLKQHEFDRCYLITSAGLLKMFGRELLGTLDAARVPCAPVLINDTERFKTWDTLQALCEELIARGVTRDSILIGMGGGVLGNVAGLAAALIYRGIRFVEVPTTVTGQTDSTLSNKQAINGAMGKNQFGVYHAPLFVWADAAYPRTEPPRGQRSGIVEGIKNVLISHDRLDEAEAMLQMYRSPDRWPDLLLSLIRSKLRIIERDPTERGYAMVLEYGHTFGHAIEWLAAGRLLHGEAVAIGMCLAANLSHAMGYMPAALRNDHYRLLGEALGVPTRLPEWLDPQAVYDAMLADNKRTKRGLRFLLLRGCGQFVNAEGDYMVAAPPDQVLKRLRESIGVHSLPAARAG